MTQRCIYFAKPVGMDGPIKIGCSSIPLDRITQLAEWSPIPLEFLGAVAGNYMDEQFLHSCFADLHSHHEWFHPTPELRDIIEKVIQCGSVASVSHLISPKGKIRQRRNGAPNWLHPFLAAERKINRIRQEMMRAGRLEWHEPEDIARMMRDWRGDPERGIRGKSPTDAELRRLDDFLREPALHVVAPMHPLIVPHPAKPREIAEHAA